MRVDKTPLTKTMMEARCEQRGSSLQLRVHSSVCCIVLTSRCSSSHRWSSVSLSSPLRGERACVCVSMSLLCFVLAWTLARFSFVAQPLEHLDGFKLCPFFLWLLLDLRVLLEVCQNRKESHLNTFNTLLVSERHHTVLIFIQIRRLKAKQQQI